MGGRPPVPVGHVLVAPDPAVPLRVEDPVDVDRSSPVDFRRVTATWCHSPSVTTVAPQIVFPEAPALTPNAIRPPMSDTPKSP